jgi:hypothetical protein
MDVGQSLTTASDSAAASLATPGDWLTGAQRCSVWREGRSASTNELDIARRLALSPTMIDDAHPPTDVLNAASVDVVHRLATDPGRLTRTWAAQRIEELGEETYTELVAVTAIAMVIDRFDESMGRPLRSLPEPQAGEPKRIRPDDVGDVGAWVAQTLAKTRANVSRALTLVPETQGVWRTLVDTFYSRGAEFLDLHWDRALSRPQVELIAARTTALNECFY